MSTPPSGWYPDPEAPEFLRYWDGEQWTNQFTHAVQGRIRPTATPDDEPLASPLVRLLAELVDATTILPVILVLGWPFISRISDANWSDLESQVGNAGELTSGAAGSVSTTMPLLGLLIVAMAVSATYRLAMWRWRSATLGQLAFSLRVRPWSSDVPVHWRAALIRSTVQTAFLPLLAVPTIGWIAILWPLTDAVWTLRDDRRQTLHDKLAGTCVVGGADEDDLEDEGISLVSDPE
jgi:uncharacterized RDD family membrane protein YckC